MDNFIAGLSIKQVSQVLTVFVAWGLYFLAFEILKLQPASELLEPIVFWCLVIITLVASLCFIKSKNFFVDFEEMYPQALSWLFFLMVCSSLFLWISMMLRNKS